MQRYGAWDLILPISFVVSFAVASMFVRRKHWCIFESVISFVFGCSFILTPSIILRFQIAGGKFNGVHTFLVRQCGAILVGQSISAFQSRNSIDARMFGNIFYANVFASVLLLCNQVYDAFHLWDPLADRFSDKYIIASACGIGCWFLCSLIHLVKCKEIGSYTRKSCYVNFGFLVDHFVLLAAAAVLLAFPTQIFKLVMEEKNVDDVHLHFLRSLPALMIRQALVSNAATGFLYTRDRRGHIVGRLTAQILVFGINIFGHFVTGIFTAYHVVPFMATGFYITFLLTVLFRFGEEDQSMKRIRSKSDGLNLKRYSATTGSRKENSRKKK